MLAHVGIIVSDIDNSKKFYAAALEAIGYRMKLTAKNKQANLNQSFSLREIDCPQASD